MRRITEGSFILIDEKKGAAFCQVSEAVTKKRNPMVVGGRLGEKKTDYASNRVFARIRTCRGRKTAKESGEGDAVLKRPMPK